ncbi:unnamed protein product [Pipistrellus nathusii]|uniref:Uncharacterized protein n=1 Tax=Pipistrellus nathusii TaxID=59473 RepID=A0ABN9ZLZ9_PIPNA
MLALSENFCGDLYPRTILPPAFSHPSLPHPHPAEAPEVVCSCAVTLGRRTTWGGSGKQQGNQPLPTPHPALGKHVSPSPRHKSVEHGLLGRPRLPQPQSLQGREVRARSEWKHVLACGCVFSHADGPFSPVPPCLPQASGPAPSSSSHSRWEQASD